MKTTALSAALGATLMLAPAPAKGQGADVLLNCSACHQVGPPAPQPRTPSPYPNLNGQPARYIERQLEAYLEGLRKHPQMQASAMALGEGAPAMARLYADAPAPDLVLRGTRADHAEAMQLVTRGDPARGLPSCASCHAMDPDDRARLSPRLHGLPPAYLATQLRAYADGTRASDPMGRMRSFSAVLSSAEISALAAFYGAWVPRALTETPDDE